MRQMHAIRRQLAVAEAPVPTCRGHSLRILLFASFSSHHELPSCSSCQHRQLSIGLSSVSITSPPDVRPAGLCFRAESSALRSVRGGGGGRDGATDKHGQVVVEPHLGAHPLYFVILFSLLSLSSAFFFPLSLSSAPRSHDSPPTSYMRQLFF